LEFAEADSGGVGDQQQGNAQAERELPCLARGQPEMTSAIERVKSERAVHEKAGVENDQPDIRLPRSKQKRARSLHGCNRSNAERVIDEVRGRKSE
jgi:hypothetical protein